MTKRRRVVADAVAALAEISPQARQALLDHARKCPPNSWRSAYTKLEYKVRELRTLARLGMCVVGESNNVDLMEFVLWELDKLSEEFCDEWDKGREEALSADKAVSQ